MTTEKKDLRDAWQRFDRGDFIDTPTLETMISQAEAALEYMWARGPEYRLAATPTHLAVQKMRDWVKARKGE